MGGIDMLALLNSFPRIVDYLVQMRIQINHCFRKVCQNTV